MHRLLISREYPPAPGGGIGTYAGHIARALADAGDTVHVISQRWPGAEAPRETRPDGRLVVHRLPVERPGWLFGTRAHRALPTGIATALWHAGGAAAAFAWQAAALAEALIVSEPIELIEAPEYEAPLYYLMLRRAQGLAPAARPPCMVHLHSPTALLAVANGEEPSLPRSRALAALENQCIRAADGLLCPSRYLTDQVTAHVGLPAGAIAIIRYPLGGASPVLRPPSAWANGPILYVGRLELRKGILEWLQAAVALASEDPSLHFEFVGADHLDYQVGGDAWSRIPPRLRSRFVFRGPLDRGRLEERLAAARLAIVPSRWENFPYTCIEAMASGLPVVVSPDGGMSEMVVHDATGWIARSHHPDDLADAVRQALRRSPAELALVGAQAANAVARLCDEQQVVAGHQDLARQVIATGTRNLAQLDGWPREASRCRQRAPGDRPVGQLAFRRGRPGHDAALLAPARGIAASLDDPIDRQAPWPPAAGGLAMKIALLSFEYPPETGFGGIGTYTWYHARALVKLGHEVHVLAGATAPTPLRTTEHDGVVVHRHRADGAMTRTVGLLARRRMWWTKNRLETAWSMYRGLRRLERDHRFDVIEMPECGGEGVLLNRLTDTPTVVRFHSPAELIMPFYDVVPADTRWCARAERIGISGATRLTSCSRFLADEVHAKLGEARPIEVVPNGIDVALFDAADQLDFRRRFAIPAGRPMIFFAGRMEPRKGVHLLPEILVPLLERHEVAVVLAGDDLFHHVRDTLEPALAGHRLRGSFHYLGKLDQVAIRSGVCQSDVFLLPSLWENCPYSCLEAMAAGRAIVASNQGGMPELIEDGVSGLLAESGVAESYLERLECLIGDADLRQRLGAAARRRVGEHFTDVTVARRAVTAYCDNSPTTGAAESA